MKLHPVDIAKELSQYHFFRTFPQELLLQVATLVSAVSFKKGDVILKEGDSNKNLYFLRKGHAEVMLAGEVVALLQNPGEVIGEMSVVTARPVSTSIKAGTDIEAFLIDTDNFNFVSAKEKDHFLHLLYRIYSNILAERLVKTNEKARLFEIANRELHQAQMSLDSAGNKVVLLVESDKKQLALAKVALGSTGVQLDTASDIETAKELLKTNKYDAIIVDKTCLEFLRFAHESKIPSRLIMMTPKNVSSNLSTYKDMSFIDTLMTRDPEDRNFTIRTILTTLSKVLNHELFGLEKYLTWGVEVRAKTVKASTEREALREEMCAYFKKLGVRSTILDRLNTVSEEMLMNAIYDAPTDSKGKPLYNHLPRQTEIILESHLQSNLRYGSDGVFLAISVTDPFGALSKEIIFNYLESCYGGADQPSEHKGKGGAGRGLHQIVENADITIFNVKRGVKTEVICLFYVEGHRKEPEPSFHFFFV
jgi:CRP-like cAMP-binding protein